MKLPLAEHFHSIQGEGQWVGTPMHFIRLAGCSVGQLHSAPRGVGGPHPTLSSGKSAWLCHAYDGRPFFCDTDFNKYEEIELEDLLSETWENHICLTGGEPLIHRDVVDAFRKMERPRRESGLVVAPPKLHIETSGTIDFWWEAELLPYPRENWTDPWITVSPKRGWTPHMTRFANELKLLISSDTPDHFPDEFLRHPNVFLSPINHVGADLPKECQINDDSLKRCHELLRSHPNWRLSVQLHKYLGVR